MEYLNIPQQKGLKPLPSSKPLPKYRISLEACEFNSISFQQSQWLKQFNNPLVFLHHYSNPQSNPTLFEKVEDKEWFANACANFITSNREIKHICPISQPTAFAFRVARGNDLPPFTCSLDKYRFLTNIIGAHAAAYKAIKKINPDIFVYVSHQWKIFKPYHSSIHPAYALELFISKFANKMYNTAFVEELKKHSDCFDRIALSLYPAVPFYYFVPIVDNLSENFDAEEMLETIKAIHKEFPNKEIIIAETGCNSPNSDIKNKFIDTLLYVCLKARRLGININGIYLWNHTDDIDYYWEWNKKPGSTNFGLFDKLDPNLTPEKTINQTGIYLKEIITG